MCVSASLNSLFKCIARVTQLLKCQHDAKKRLSQLSLLKAQSHPACFAQRANSGSGADGSNEVCILLLAQRATDVAIKEANRDETPKAQPQKKGIQKKQKIESVPPHSKKRSHQTEKGVVATPLFFFFPLE